MKGSQYAREERKKMGGITLQEHFAMLEDLQVLPPGGVFLNTLGILNPFVPQSAS